MSAGGTGRLAGRRVLVTGAASGIGFATARLFVQEGARVVMLDRNGDALSGCAAMLGTAAEAVTADVADQASVARAVNDGAAAVGGLDGVVNCAAISLPMHFEDMGFADWSRVMAVNLDGPFFVCQAALPHLRRAAPATIVNIGSGVALRPIAAATAYAASKGGLIAFSKALAVELAPSDIRVNVVCPGIVETPMVRRRIDQADDPDAMARRLMDLRLLKRFGTPDEIAHAILFLTASDCAFVTGSVLAVDGGGAFH